MYPILYYNGLDTNTLETKFNKVVNALQQGEFKSVQAKKLKPGPFYRAKLDDKNRLLFSFIRFNNKSHLLLLEIIYQHNYERSRFLNHAEIQETQICEKEFEQDAFVLHAHSENTKVHYLDKLIMFDSEQDQILQFPLPLIIIGSAGSGKTSVTLEKLKHLTGKILYVSLSSYLVQHTQKTYFANHYQNDEQEIDFLSFDELLQTIEIPNGREISADQFLQWFKKQNNKHFQDGRKLFEEFRGVLTGSEPNTEYLSLEDYLSLGIKQSIYPEKIREEVYALFKKYLDFLNDNKLYDSNIIASRYHIKASPIYDAVVIDEVQDFTNSQLSLILKTLTIQGQFLLCGDANQIVHPNFFSWSKLKTYFYHDDLGSHNITRILTKNYRNSAEITELANRILKLKNHRFGSIDKESHYLSQSVSTTKGRVNCFPLNSKVLQEINQKTATSVHHAVIVLHEDDKEKAAKQLDTPLIFTVQEAKGLEYQNIILYNFINSDTRYQDIAKGVQPDYLSSSFKYARTKDKNDKSLETYKFYINALYVAVTRAIQNVYILEDNPKHRFLSLLEINEINDILIEEARSSAEEWQKEASKLAQQGKEKQAKSIQDKVLKQKQVPWTVLNQAEFNKQKQDAIENKANKKTLIYLLNYAHIYQNSELINTLQQLNVKAAFNIKKSITLMEDEYFKPYLFRSEKLLHTQLRQYGLEFRNPFNLTPLMCAAFMGNAHHVETLINQGACREEIDNDYRNAFMIAFNRAITDEFFLENKLPNVYSLLAPEAISLQIDKKLVKIPQYKAEYFLFFYLLTQTRHHQKHNKVAPFIFTAVQLCDFFQKLTNTILPEYRKKRPYISSMLSKNEENSNSPYNHQLFTRLRRGVYQLRNDIQIKVQNEWKAIIQNSE